MTTVGLAIMVLLLGLFFFNGLAMLISPRRWFQMPEYFAFHGGRQRKLLNSIGGRLQIRLVGMLFTAAASYMLAAMFPSSFWSLFPAAGVRRWNVPFLPLFAMACFSGAIGTIVLGVAMLLRPRAWFRKYMLDELSDRESLKKYPVDTLIASMQRLEPVILVFIRALGLAPLICGCYALWYFAGIFRLR